MPSGSSGTPLPKKLGLKEGHLLVLVGAPAGWKVDDLPAGVRTVRRLTSLRPDDRPDAVIGFFRTAAQVRGSGPELAGGLGPTASLWLAWPRRAGGHDSDITDQLLREVLLPLGVVDVKVAALDTDWSALKFVWRKSRREESRR
jgi:hypothetical protein